MKKFLIILFHLFCFSQMQANCNKVCSNSVTMNHVRVGSTTKGSTKAPAAPLYLWQDDYTFTLPAFEESITLQLIDDNEDVVYTAVVPAGVTTVTFPSSYTGDYLLRLVVSATSYYIGDITL